MAKRYFLQKAHTYNPKKHGIGGWWYSEKLDGHRAFWDGGISRGMPKDEVPWANIDKDERFKNRQIATGLWSQYGNVIHAPSLWLDTLPLIPLDGELWAPILSRQEIGSIIKQHKPDYRWLKVCLKVFDSPPLQIVFADGFINTPHYIQIFEDIIDWINQQHYSFEKVFEANAQYRSIQLFLEKQLNKDSVKWHLQYQLPYQTTLANKIINRVLKEVDNLGGEGLIIRNPDALYRAERVHTIVKVKKYDDAEGKVIGYVTGKGKLCGMMGAMIIEWNDKIFEISGFTDNERRFAGVTKAGRLSESTCRTWAYANPEKKCPNWIEARYFPRGSRVTFKYRGLTDDGIPNEASYWRKEEII
jgi:DNA ligase-1